MMDPPLEPRSRIVSSIRPTTARSTSHPRSSLSWSSVFSQSFEISGCHVDRRSTLSAFHSSLSSKQSVPSGYELGMNVSPTKMPGTVSPPFGQNIFYRSTTSENFLGMCKVVHSGSTTSQTRNHRPPSSEFPPSRFSRDGDGTGFIHTGFPLTCLRSTRPWAKQRFHGPALE